MHKIISTTSEQTMELGEKIGKSITRAISIALTGDLGAGKTTLVQGMAKGLGISEEYYITSPTFNIINEYPSDNFRLCHLDLYRLGSAEELEYIGFEDLAEENCLIIVEWPSILEEIQFDFDLKINFEFDPDYNRVISLVASGHKGTNLLSKLFS